MAEKHGLPPTKVILPWKNLERYSEEANLFLSVFFFPFILFLIFHISLILKEMESNTKMIISTAEEQPAIGVLSAGGVRVLDEPIPVETNKVGGPKPSGSGIQRGTNPHYALRSGDVLPKPAQRPTLPKVQQPRERKSRVAQNNGSAKKGGNGSKGFHNHAGAQGAKVGGKVGPNRLHSPAAASSSSVSVKEKVRGGEPAPPKASGSKPGWTKLNTKNVAGNMSKKAFLAQAEKFGVKVVDKSEIMMVED